MVFPFRLPRSEAEPSDLLIHAQCFRWWSCGCAERNTTYKDNQKPLPALPDKRTTSVSRETSNVRISQATLTFVPLPPPGPRMSRPSSKREAVLV